LAVIPFAIPVVAPNVASAIAGRNGESLRICVRISTALPDGTGTLSSAMPFASVLKEKMFPPWKIPARAKS